MRDFDGLAVPEQVRALYAPSTLSTRLLLTSYHSPLTTYYLLLTTYYSLLTTYHLLLTTYL